MNSMLPMNVNVEGKLKIGAGPAVMMHYIFSILLIGSIVIMSLVYNEKIRKKKATSIITFIFFLVIILGLLEFIINIVLRKMSNVNMQ